MKRRRAGLEMIFVWYLLIGDWERIPLWILWARIKIFISAARLDRYIFADRGGEHFAEIFFFNIYVFNKSKRERARDHAWADEQETERTSSVLNDSFVWCFVVDLWVFFFLYFLLPPKFSRFISTLKTHRSLTKTTWTETPSFLLQLCAPAGRVCVLYRVVSSSLHAV